MLTPCFRLNYDPVGNNLKPIKAHMVLGSSLTLTKGKPLKVSWKRAA